jgi:predicted HTH transcriptional regulator
VDYKSAKPAPRDARQRAELAKHVIGLSNRKDGGYLLIGVQDSTLVPVGLTEAQVASWDAAGVNSWGHQDLESTEDGARPREEMDGRRCPRPGNHEHGSVADFPLAS